MLALITSEGGMSCAYSVGTILGLIEHYKLTNPDMVIGSSGSTGTLAYYVSGQHDSIRNIWSNLLSTKELVSYRRLNRVIDIDYLIDEVFGKQDKLDVDAISKSKIDLYIGATDFVTGESHYFSNRSGDNILEALRASSAMPMVYGKKITVNGKRYIDGAISANLADNIKKAKSLGADKILAIDTINHNASANFVLKFYSWFCNDALKRTINKYFETNLVNLVSTDENILLIKPSRPLKTSSLDNRREHLLDAIELGYKDIVENEKVEGFVIKNRSSARRAL